MGEALPAPLLSLSRGILEGSAGEDALARWKAMLKFFPVMRGLGNKFNSLLQAYMSAKNSGPLFIICITVAPRGPKLLGFVERFVGESHYP